MIPVDRVLWRYLPGDGTPTHSRTGTATYVDADLVVQSAADGVIRDQHRFSLDGPPHTLLEPARTQVANDPEAPNNWGDIGTPVITTGQTDPWGGTAAILVEDNAAGSEGSNTACTFTGDGEKVVICAVRAGSAAVIRVQVRDLTDVVARHQVNVEWQGGTTAPTVTTSGGSGTIYDPVRVDDADGNVWWLIPFSATGVVAANDNRLWVLAGTAAAATGTFYLAGGNAFDAVFPTSWQGGSLGTRNTDTFSVPIAFGPLTQGITMYLALVPGRAENMGQSGIITIGTNADVPTSAASLAVHREGGNSNYSVRIANGSTNEVRVSDPADHLAVREILAGYEPHASDGTVRPFIALDGGAIVYGSYISPPSAWDTQNLYLRSSEGAAFRSVGVYSGVVDGWADARDAAYRPYLSFDDGTPRYLAQTVPTLTDWLPDRVPVGPHVHTLGGGVTHEYVYRTDYLARFRLQHLTPNSLADALRLRAHLLGGGTMEVLTADRDHNAYTVRLAPGEEPELTFDDPQNLDYGLQLPVKNTAAAAMPVRYA